MPRRAERPNILFIHTDSMDGRAMGCMGHPALQGVTPNIDSLAARGTIFENTYCNNPICCPSRASMMSGLFTHHCEGWNNYKGLEPGVPTFFTALEKGGYEMKVVGKTDYVSGKHTIRARVSPWTRTAGIPLPNYRMPPPHVFQNDEQRVLAGDWKNADAAMDWLRAGWAKDRPFFLHVGPNLPHPPFKTSRRYLDRIDPKKVTLPKPDESDHPVMAYQRINKNWEHGFDDEMVLRVRRIYFAMIAEVDELVGGVLQTLRELGLEDSTQVIFSSDHGELAMEHGQYYKMSAYEASARVPLILAGPGVKSGRRVSALASLVDIHPTLMDMAGLPRARGLDGHSLMPEARGRKGSRPDWALCEYDDTSCNASWFMLRHGKWKYVAYPGFPPQLFDLRTDPDELRNLAETDPKTAAAMDRRLRKVVDYEAVDARVKAYDRAAFRKWRAERKAAGDYTALMSRIFSGWDEFPGMKIRRWRPSDEKKIEAWLKGEERAS